MDQGFAGFPKAGIAFLRDLAANNDRAWFQPRKGEYERLVLDPMRALVDELSAMCASLDVPIFGTDKASIFRVHRDVRFSKNKSPYKVHAACYLSRDGGRTTPGGLYVHVDPKGSFVGAAFYGMEAPLLARWRKAMRDKPKAFERVVAALAERGRAIEPPQADDGSLKRMPRGYEELAEMPLAPYFRLKNFVVHASVKPSDLTSAKLVDVAHALVRDVKPLLAYGWAIVDGMPVA
jgi:uncharacterized protein (TIGR02453 family)